MAKILNSMYVDDIVSGAETEEKAYTIYMRTKALLKSASFNLRKFASNSNSLQEVVNLEEAQSYPESELQYTTYPDGQDLQSQLHSVSHPEEGNAQSQIQPVSHLEAGVTQSQLQTTSQPERKDQQPTCQSSPHPESFYADETFAQTTLGGQQKLLPGEQGILGVKWDITTDQFIFNFGELARSARGLKPTKRSLVGSFYDPLGFLAPIVVKFKIFLQTLCKAKLGWDDTLTCSLQAEWKSLVTGLLESQTLSLPRCYLYGMTEEIVSYSLRGFCDASLSAYAAVVYLVVETISGIFARFVVAKTRVSPLKQQSVPRLELLSALLLARVMHSVFQSLEIEIALSSVCCYSDSQVALHWIKGIDKSWKPFVQNRASEIRMLVPIEHWRHCPGQHNPADLPSCGATPLELSASLL